MSNYIEVHLRHWSTPIVSFTADKFLAWQETWVDVLPKLRDASSKPIKDKKSPDDFNTVRQYSQKLFDEGNLGQMRRQVR